MDAKDTVIGYEFFAPLGAMNKDANYRQINYNAGGQQTGGMDYVDAQNVNAISLVEDGDDYWYAVNGNVLAITPPSIVTQNKVFSVSFPNTTGKTLGIHFLNLNGSDFSTDVDCVFTPTTGNLATDTSSFITMININLTAGGWSSVVTSPTPGTIHIELVGLTGFDYQIVEDSSNNVALTIITIKEAWDASIAGLCYPTGSKDWLGDLFIESSSVGKDPASFSISNTGNSSGNIKIEVTGNITSDITVGDAVNVGGVEGTVEANGIWLVSVISYSGGITTITLYNSTYTNAYSGGGIITVNIYGFSNISVSQQNVETQAWTTWNLLQTKQINSRWNHPYRNEDADSADQIINLYMTDNNDYPRTFSYTGPYMTNGAIQYYNSLGEYTYEDVDESTRNIIGVPMPIFKVTGWTDAGGAIESGNWRYTGFLQNSDLVSTGTGIFTNPINVYNGSFGSPSTIMGTPGEVSTMTVTITVSEIPEGFSYINLIGINYTGESEVAYLIKTVPIPANVTSMTITHTGLEQGIENYGSGFSLPSIAYVKAGTQCISNGTLLYGNLTAAQINDFTEVSQTFTHVLGKNTTVLPPTGDDRFGYTLGEYQGNVATSPFYPATPTATGYMLNETVRFWCCYELNTGVFTPLFWCDDIRFDLGATTNVANPFQGQSTRRTGNAITNYDLSPSVSSTAPPYVNSFVFYVTFENNGIGDYIIDGVPLSSIVKRVHFFRTDNNAAGLNEVLTCGLIVRHAAGTISNAGSQLYGTGGGGAANYLFENPFLLTPYVNLNFPIGDPNPPFNVYFNTWSELFGTEPNGWQYGLWNGWGGISANTVSSCSFYSPDWIYGQVDISYTSEDTLLEYGTPDWNTGNTSSDMDSTTLTAITGGGSTQIIGTEFRLSGATHVSTDAFAATGTINLGLQQAVPVAQFAGTVNGIGGLVYCSGTTNNVPTYLLQWDTPQKLWLYTGVAIPEPSLSTSAPDVGLHYAQYYRPIGNGGQGSSAAQANYAQYPNNTKFGAITTGTGIPTGAYIDISDNADTVSVDVYGGDTFTQKSFLKIRYPTNDNPTFPYNVGGGNTVVFFCQNRMNFNMRNPANLAYPATPPINDWILWPIDIPGSSATEIDNYDPGYTPRNPDNTLGVFNPALPNQTLYPDRKIFSQTKPQGSTINNFRIFPPLNFNDDQTNKGDITSLVIIDEELFVLQPKAFWRHFYNDTGTFQGEGTGDVTLGSSAPFSKPPKLISNNGCSNIFSVIQGKGLQGEDVACWWDTINKKIMMYSRNGLRDISTENNMRSFIFNNIQYVTGDVPIMQNAISGVFDEKRKEFIWTVYNVNTGLEAWNGVDVDYFVGNIATYGTTFEGLPAAWICTANNFDKQPDINPNYWKPYTQAYTIAYNLYANDGKGGFNTFYTPKPYFYAQWKDTYLSAYPNVTDNPFNGIFLSDVGSELVWYSWDSISQTDVGTLTYVNNKDRQRYKQYFNLEVNSLIAPYLMNFTTEQYASYLASGEFSPLNNILWRSQIKNDMLSSNPLGLNNQWTSPMRGNYMVSMLTFLAGQGQKVSSFVTKYINRLKY